MEIQLNYQDTKTSNNYLRSLWSEFRTFFGKCVWHFSPYKQGDQKRVFFGWMDIGPKYSEIGVSIYYSKKGCLKTICFESNNNKIEESLIENINTVHKNAQKKNW